MRRWLASARKESRRHGERSGGVTRPWIHGVKTSLPPGYTKEREALYGYVRPSGEKIPKIADREPSDDVASLDQELT